MYGWSDGLAIRSTGCSCRGPEYESQHPHAAPVPGSYMPSSGIQEPTRHICGAQTYMRQKIPRHK